jgi:hypothetical protein
MNAQSEERVKRILLGGNIDGGAIMLRPITFLVLEFGFQLYIRI